MKKISAKSNALAHGAARFKILEDGREVFVSPWRKNKIALSDNKGMNLVLKRHIGTLTYDVEVTQGRFGTSNTARTAVQADLIAPYATYYPRTHKYMVDDTSCIVEFYVPSSLLPNGTYREFAIYCGTRYFASVVLGPELVKGTNQDVLVQYKITYST